MDSRDTLVGNRGSEPSVGDPFYRNATCCEQTLHVDDMFGQFAREKGKLLDDLLTSPHLLKSTLWQAESPLSIDRACLWKMGETVPSAPSVARDQYVSSYRMMPLTRGTRRSHSCPQCRNMSRIVDLNKTPIGMPFTIETGNEMGKRFLLNKVPISRLFCDLKDRQQELSMHSVQHYRRTSSELPEYLLVSDEFTNNILIAFLLDYLIPESGIASCCSLVTAFVCGNDGYTLNEATLSLEELAKIPEYTDENHSLRADILFGIYQQLFSLLRVLNSYDFIHGIPTQALSFRREPCAYMIDGISIHCPVTLVLSNFKSSSISIDTAQGRIRLCSSSFLPNLHSNKRNPSLQNGKFHLSVPQMEVYQHLQKVGIPMGACIEIYIFILTLMRCPSFRSGVFNSEFLRTFWQSLEIPDSIFDNLSQGALGSDKVEFLVTQFPLRCDILDKGWWHLTQTQE